MRREIAEILSFVPALSQPGRRFVQKWNEPGPGDHLPYPEYFPDVEKFFQTASLPYWFPKNYDPREAFWMLPDRAFIARADLEQLRSMITMCVRSERIVPGSWCTALESGVILRILERLKQIHDLADQI